MFLMTPSDDGGGMTRRVDGITGESGSNPDASASRHSITLFTLGSSGKTAEEFFTLLKDNGVRRVVDVRLKNNSPLLGFTRQANGPYSQIFLTHIDENGHSSPPVELAHFTAADRAANIPEFVNAPPAALTKIVEQFVDDLSHWRAGNEYLKAKDWQGAERMYRKALEINPNYADAHHSLGVVLATRGRVDEAIAHFQKALEINPDDVKIRRNLEVARSKRK